MSKTTELNNFIQAKFKELEVDEITANEMAQYLDKAGILKDSTNRPGLPLRNYLRAGRIVGGHQYPNNRWVIRRDQSYEGKLTVKQAAVEMKISEQALYKRIERGSILPERIGQSISIPQSEIKKKGEEDIESESTILLESIKKEFLGIHFEIENVLNRINKLERLFYTLNITKIKGEKDD